MEEPRWNYPAQEEPNKAAEKNYPDNGKTELGYEKLSHLRAMLWGVPRYEAVVKILDGLCDQAVRLEPSTDKIREGQDQLKMHVEYDGLGDLYSAIQAGRMTPELTKKYSPGEGRG